MSRKLNFTNEKIENLKPVPRAQTDYYDARGNQLGIRIGGRKKSWFLSYRSRGTHRRTVIGHYPQMTLADARKIAKQRGSDDVGATRRNEKKLGNFNALVEKFLTVHGAHLRPKTLEEYTRLLKSLTKPKAAGGEGWGDLRIVDVTREKVFMFLEKKAALHPHTANRYHGVLLSLFNWSVQSDLRLTAHHPLAGMKRPGFGGKKEPKRDRVLRYDEIRGIWEALEKEEPVLQAFIKTVLLTGLRKTETLTMRWHDVDLEAGWLLIPRTAAKSGRALELPISDPLRDVLTSLHKFTGGREYVFASFHTGKDEPIVWTDKKKKRISKNAKIDPKTWREHDLRRTVRTNLSRLGVPRLTSRLILGQSVGDEIDQTYDLHDYRIEKQEALGKWATRLMEIVSTEEVVVEFQAKAKADV